MLKELMPAARHVALLRLTVLEFSDAQELEGAFRAAKERGASALVALSDPMTGSNAHRIAALSFEYRIPVVSPGRPIVEAGGVLAYGPNIALLFRRGAFLVGRILKGAKVGNLPIERPTDFELIINMKSASAFELAVPHALLSRATQVIR